MCKEPWYADIANYLATERTPSNWSGQDKHRFMTQIQFFFWVEPYLFKYWPDQIIRRCLPEDEHQSVLTFCHELAYGGHFGPRKTAEKVLQSGSTGSRSSRTLILFANSVPNVKWRVESHEETWCPLHRSWRLKFWFVGHDFMGPFPMSYDNQFILVAIDYVSKWAEAVLTRTNDNQVVIKFLRENIISRFGAPVR